MEETPYSQLRATLTTGDIVLFAGKGGISRLIKWAQRSTWSHVGMILRPLEWDTILLWESTSLSKKVKDVELGKAMHGVQLVALSARLAEYDGAVAVRRISNPITPDMCKALREFRLEVQGRPYETNYLELAKAAYDGVFGENTEDLTSLFCSELIAEGLQRAKLLPEPPDGLPSNEYTPRDFSTEAKQPLELLGAYSLGDEILVKR